MKTNKHVIGNLLANIGMALVAVATALPLLHLLPFESKFIYAAGAVITLIGRISGIDKWKGEDLKTRRLGRLEFWSAIMFCVGAFFLFYPKAGATDWIAFTLAGAVLQIYSFFRLGLKRR